MKRKDNDLKHIELCMKYSSTCNRCPRKNKCERELAIEEEKLQRQMRTAGLRKIN